MKVLVGLGAAMTGALCLPAVALLAVVTVGGAALACTEVVSADAALAASAPVPSAARSWIAMTHAACPDLPVPWIAAVMAQESDFRPTARADDRNGGTRGLFQLNATVWRAAYGATWDADLDRNGTPDIEDPTIHATTAGRYLCERLDGVRRLRAAHSDWTATRLLSDLDTLVIAHNAGEAWLIRYPDLPGVTREFLRQVTGRVGAWTDVEVRLGQSGPSPGGAGISGLRPSAVISPPLCPPEMAIRSSGGLSASASPAIGTIAGDPTEVAAAIRRAHVLARDRSGWLHWCDRLVCRAYGYTNSGYVSAIVHWKAMSASGLAHPRDRCPPTGAFLFWTTSGPYGHAALVTHGDTSCDPGKTFVLSNMVLDREQRTSGGVYIVSLARIESGFVLPGRYLGWTPPRCIGQRQ